MPWHRARRAAARLGFTRFIIRTPGCAAGFGGPNCDICAINYWSAGGTNDLPTKACIYCGSLKKTYATGSTKSTDCVACERVGFRVAREGYRD